MPSWHGDVAALVVDGHGYFARAATEVGGPWWGAVARLVAGVREREDHADLLLRRRIVLPRDPTEIERALVQVVAKKVRRSDVRPEADGWTDVGPDAERARARAVAAFEAGDGERGGEADWLARADAVARTPDTSRPRWARHRAVGAVLVDGDGRCLGAAPNLSGDNRILHAEVVLALGWWAHSGGGFPGGARVFVSLTPCRMCAGALLIGAARPGLGGVVAHRRDRGRLASDTLLDRASLLRTWEATGAASEE